MAVSIATLTLKGTSDPRFVGISNMLQNEFKATAFVMGPTETKLAVFADTPEDASQKFIAIQNHFVTAGISFEVKNPTFPIVTVDLTKPSSAIHNQNAVGISPARSVQKEEYCSPVVNGGSASSRGGNVWFEAGNINTNSAAAADPALKQALEMTHTTTAFQPVNPAPL